MTSCRTRDHIELFPQIVYVDFEGIMNQEPFGGVDLWQFYGWCGPCGYREMIEFFVILLLAY